MKNIYLYYFTFLTPAILLIYFWESLPSTTSLTLLFTYVFVYRSLIDGLRLKAKGVLQSREIWKIAIPGVRGKYFKELYLQK